MGLKHLFIATCIFLAAVFFHASMQPVLAGTCSIDNLPTTGTMTASRFNSRYTQVESCINGSIGDTNWDSSDPLSVGNLENNQSTFALGPIENFCNTTGTDRDPFQVPNNSTITGFLVYATGCTTDNFDIDLVYEDTPTTVKTLTITTSNTYSDFALSKAVALGTDINFDVSGTVGTCSCTGFVYLKTQHVQ